MISSPCTNRLFARIFNLQYRHPPPFSLGTPRRWKAFKTCGEVCKRAAPRPICVEESVVTLSVCTKLCTTFWTFHVTQFLPPPPAMGFAVMLWCKTRGR